VVVVVEPAVAIKATIHPDNVKTLLQQPRPEHGTDISVDSGNQYPHSRHIRLMKNGNYSDQKDLRYEPPPVR
jgi:hypothetical protein